MKAYHQFHSPLENNTEKLISMLWSVKRFEVLSPFELYAILQLRNIVFAVEQSCVYQDMDNKDQASYHLMCWQNEQLLAYSRILPPGIAYTEPSIGRVVTAPKARRTGMGRKLIEKSIEHLYSLYPQQNIRIGAQCYLRKFYADFGFKEQGNIYLEDGIKHIEMVKFLEY